MINQTAEYALRAVVYLASVRGTAVTRRALATFTQVPNDYLTKVMQSLDRAGLVRSQRGPGGGYVLITSPDATTVYDVISAVTTIPRIVECPLGIAEHTKLCPLHKALDAAAELVEQAYRGTSIADLVAGRTIRRLDGVSCRFPR